MVKFIRNLTVLDLVCGGIFLIALIFNPVHSVLNAGLLTLTALVVSSVFKNILKQNNIELYKVLYFKPFRFFNI